MTGAVMRARVSGWATTLLLACIALGTASGVLAFGGPAVSGLDATALALGTAGILVGLAATIRARGADRRGAALVGELDALARRLVRVEDQLFNQTFGPRSQEDRPTDWRDLSSDMEALGAGFRSLAEAVSAQDRELTELREAARAPRTVPVPPTAPPAPAPAPESAPAPRPAPILFQPVMPGLAERGPAFLAALDALAVPSFLPQAPADLVSADRAPAVVAAPVPAAPDADPDRDGAIRAAVTGRRVEPHVAAIVTLPQRRTLVHEMLGLLTLADGTVLMPDEYRTAVARLDLAADLDAQLMGHAVEAAGALAAAGREGVIATPLSRRTLVDPVALERAVATIGDGPAAERIILTLAGADWSLPAAIRDVLARLGRRGVGFALTDLDEPPAEAAVLAAAGIRYVKVPAERLFDPARADETAAATEIACRRLAEHGIRLVASDVNEEALVPELIDCGVPLAQGYAMAIPVPVSALARPAAAARATVEAEPAETRRPLRSVLRRIG